MSIYDDVDITDDRVSINYFEEHGFVDISSQSLIVRVDNKTPTNTMKLLDLMTNLPPVIWHTVVMRNVKCIPELRFSNISNRNGTVFISFKYTKLDGSL